MTAKDSKLPWWHLEYEEILADLAKSGEKGREISSAERRATSPKPKLSDVLRCARMARQEPEIWNLAKEEALLPKEIWDSDYRSPMPHLTGPFYRLFMFRNGLRDYLPYAFMMVGPIVTTWAHPDFDGNEVASARSLLQPEDYIDDLQDEGSERVQ